jgi:hypothetical protein
MRRVFGPRTVVEAAFLVAVPVVAAALGASMWTIIAASAVAYLLIFVLEATLWREGATKPGRPRIRIPSRTALVKTQETPPAAAAPETVVVLPDTPESAVEAEPEPVVAPAPQSVAEPVSTETPPIAAEPSFTETTPSEHVRVLRPEPVLEAVPDLVAERPQLTAVPEPEPEAEPDPAPAPIAVAPEPAREPSTVVPIGVGAGPRQWNLWDLERLTREHLGGDVVQDEERQFLLMYLREFADSDGQLPLDFDGLVRDSFGELVGTR